MFDRMGEKFASVLVALRSRFYSGDYSADGRAATRVAPSALVNEPQTRGLARNALVNGETGAHRIRQLGPGVDLDNENPTLLALGKAHPYEPESERSRWWGGITT